MGLDARLSTPPFPSFSPSENPSSYRPGRAPLNPTSSPLQASQHIAPLNALHSSSLSPHLGSFFQFYLFRSEGCAFLVPVRCARSPSSFVVIPRNVDPCVLRPSFLGDYDASLRRCFPLWTFLPGSSAECGRNHSDARDGDLGRSSDCDLCRPTSRRPIRSPFCRSSHKISSLQLENHSSMPSGRISRAFLLAC